MRTKIQTLIGTLLITLCLQQQSVAQCEISWLEAVVGSQETCSNAEIEFRLYTSDDHSVLWDFGDGTNSNEGNTTKSYSSNGTYYVSGKLSLDCGKDTTIFDTIVIKDNPGFSWATYFQFRDDQCPNAETPFELVNWFPVENTIWNFGDGSPQEDISGYEATHQYASVGDYEISAQVKDACGNDTLIYDSVHVVNNDKFNPNVFFGFYKDTACLGSAIEYILLDGGIEDSLKWSFSDGSTYNGKKPDFNFSADGTYSLQLSMKDGCGNDTTITSGIVIGNAVQFEGYVYIDPPDSICPGESMLWSYSNVDSIVWNFSDGSSTIGSFATKEFTNLGWNNFSVTATEACGNSETVNDSIFVSNNVKADATALEVESNQKVCLGDSIAFTIFPYDSNVEIYFGDGSSDVFNRDSVPFIQDTYYYVGIVNHKYISNGVYVPFAVVTNNCGYKDSLIMDSVVVASTANGSIEVTVDVEPTVEQGDSLCGGKALQLIIEGGANYVIDYGDGTTETIISSDILIKPYTYRTAGAYQVEVIGSNSCGEQDTATLTVLIKKCDDVVFVDELQELDVKLYPNPTSGLVNLAIGEVGDYQVMVLNSQGEVIKLVTSSNALLSLNLSEESAGLYFVRIIHDDGVITKSVLLVK